MGDEWHKGRKGNEQQERQIQLTLSVGALDDPQGGAGGSCWEKGYFGCHCALIRMNEKRMNVVLCLQFACRGHSLLRKLHIMSV